MPPTRPNLVLRDPLGRLWTLGVDGSGLLTTTLGGQTESPHALRSPNGTDWILGVDVDGILFSQDAGDAYDLVNVIFRAVNDTFWILSIGNDGMLTTTQTSLAGRPLYYCRQHNTVFLKSDYGVSHPCAVAR